MPNVDTGGGGAFSFSTSTLTGYTRSIGPIDVEAKKVNVTKLESTWDETIPGDTLSIGDAVITYLHDPKATWLAPGTKDTITITRPELTTAGNPATVTGSGFVLRNRILPELSSNNEQIGELVFCFDGGTNSGTVPTYTAETDV